MWAALLMAVALSLDGFGVGLAYGMRRIHIPLGSLMVIALCTILAMGCSMLVGTWVVSSFDFIPWQIIGSGIIMVLGLAQVVRAIIQRRSWAVGAEAVPALAIHQEAAIVKPEPVLRFQVRFFGLVVQVLRAPQLADVDGSGGISVGESILLGLALAMDAFATGIGAAMAGITILVIGLVGIIQLGMIRLGQRLAGKIPAGLISKAEFMPGVVLIAIGLGKLI